MLDIGPREPGLREELGPREPCEECRNLGVVFAPVPGQGTAMRSYTCRCRRLAWTGDNRTTGAAAPTGDAS